MDELAMRFAAYDFVDQVAEKVEEHTKERPRHEIRISYFGPLTVEAVMDRIDDALCLGEGCECAWVMGVHPIPDRPEILEEH